MRGRIAQFVINVIINVFVQAIQGRFYLTHCAVTPVDMVSRKLLQTSYFDVVNERHRTDGKNKMYVWRRRSVDHVIPDGVVQQNKSE